MRARSKQSADTSAHVSAALRSPARSLNGSERQGMEAQLGGDLSPLRVHQGPTVDSAARALSAHGFAIGRDVALAQGARHDTLRHEAAHALQQDMKEPGGAVPLLSPHAPAEAEASAAVRGCAPVSRGHAPALARSPTDTDRLQTVHQNVRVSGPPAPAPTTGGPPPATPPTRQAWVDGPHTDAGTTARLLFDEAFAFLNARTFSGPSGSDTTDANLDSDAVAVHPRILARFPQITAPLNDTQIETAVRLITPSSISSLPGFMDDWMDNVLAQMAPSALQFHIDTSNSNYRAMITALINDPQVQGKLQTLASRQSGFISGAGPTAEIFVSPAKSNADRPKTLIHELIHLYAHQRYRDWMAASRDRRHYNEGMTEWLARKVMTPAELTGRTAYQDRVDTVQTQIADHVSEDGMARAFFRGEVWRLETRSAESRAAFEADTGIREGGTRSEERTASQSGAGMNQEVEPGAHYRFINLGVSETQPKAEHEAKFRQVKTQHLDPDPATQVQFVGHSSSTGSDASNMYIARLRSRAFYDMAQREGVPRTRLRDVARPPHFGESRPSVDEEDVITRAMNRRVDMHLSRGGTP